MNLENLLEQGKIKRVFCIRNKLNFAGAIVHITQRAPGKELLFLEDKDYLYMISLIKEISKKFLWDVFSFCLMPNHLHLLLKLNNPNLSKGAKALFEKYAKYFNKKYERKGHVFGGSYREALCFDEWYFLASSLYIHLNPVSAGIIKDPKEYRWSSCRLFIEPVKGKSFVNFEFVLKILDDDINKARQKYNALLEEGRKIKLATPFENPKVLQKFRIELFRSRGLDFLKTRDEILDEEILDRKIKELEEKKRLRKPEEFKARKFLIEQLLARGYNKSEIAQKLKISRITLYRYLK